MKDCPRCGQQLSYAAKACKCGWKERAAPASHNEPTKPHIQCAHDDCGNHAIVRNKTVTGWANFCESHAMQHRQQQADAYCSALGIHTPADAKAWLGRNKLLVKRQPIYERQPGEDDE